MHKQVRVLGLQPVRSAAAIGGSLPALLQHLQLIQVSQVSQLFDLAAEKLHLILQLAKMVLGLTSIAQRNVVSARCPNDCQYYCFVSQRLFNYIIIIMTIIIFLPIIEDFFLIWWPMPLSLDRKKKQSYRLNR